MASPPEHFPAVPLPALAVGQPGRVVAVPAPPIAGLDAEGIAPGRLLVIESRQPFGGPIVVRLGRARVALAMGLAREILVEPVPTDPVAP